MSVPKEYKAIRLLRHAGDYEIHTLPIHILESGEILVRVDAAGLNPSDWKTRYIQEFAGYLKPYPAQQGHDVVGTVAQLGEGVTTFAVGDKV